MLKTELERLVKAVFPLKPSFAFAYGSGIFPQVATHSSSNTIPGKTPMLDIILAYDDTETFHRHNLAQNPGHYSFLKYFGSKAITSVQRSYGGKLYFNPHVRVRNPFPVEIKYGVMQTDDLVDDLLNWSTFYVAGRLQKPVKILTEPNGCLADQLQVGLASNLSAAVQLALLLTSKEEVEQQTNRTEVELFKKITSLSYLGDIRVGIAEDPYKVEKIVANNVPHFQNLYRDLLLNVDHTTQLSPAQRMEACKQLPHAFTSTLPFLAVEDSEERSSDFENLCEREAAMQELLKEQLSHKIRRVSREQTLKGILTSGFLKSATYGWNKLHKRLGAKSAR